MTATPDDVARYMAGLFEQLGTDVLSQEVAAKHIAEHFGEAFAPRIQGGGRSIDKRVRDKFKALGVAKWERNEWRLIKR